MSGKSTKSFKGEVRPGAGFRERALGEATKKKKVNSKVKGNSNEVEVAKAMTKWTGYQFRRVPASGAIHVPLHWLAGDIFCADRALEFPFSVETKHYKKVTPGLVMKWWKQCQVDAVRIQKLPMLIYRQNGDPKGTWWIKMRVPSRIPKFLSQMELPEVPPGCMVTYTMRSTDLFAFDYSKFHKLVTYER